MELASWLVSQSVQVNSRKLPLNSPSSSLPPHRSSERCLEVSISDYCSEGPGFESRFGDRLFWLRIYVIFISLLRHVQLLLCNI